MQENPKDHISGFGLAMKTDILTIFLFHWNMEKLFQMQTNSKEPTNMPRYFILCSLIDLIMGTKQ